MFPAGRQAERGVIGAADHDAPGAQPVVQLDQVPGTVVAGSPLVGLGQAVPPQELLRPAELPDPAEDGQLLAQFAGPVQDRGAGQVQHQPVLGDDRCGELFAGLGPVGGAFLGVLSLIDDQRLRPGLLEFFDPAELLAAVGGLARLGGQRGGPDDDHVRPGRDGLRAGAGCLVHRQGGEEPADLRGPVQRQATDGTPPPPGRRRPRRPRPGWTGSCPSPCRRRSAPGGGPARTAPPGTAAASAPGPSASPGTGTGSASNASAAARFPSCRADVSAANCRTWSLIRSPCSSGQARQFGGVMPGDAVHPGCTVPPSAEFLDLFIQSRGRARRR